MTTTTVTAADLKTRFNLKTEDEAARVLALSSAEVARAFESAFRPVEQEVYDDCVLKVAGAVVGARRRPTGTGGQLTTAEQAEPIGPARDYTAPIRSTVNQYVVPFG